MFFADGRDFFCRFCGVTINGAVPITDFAPCDNFGVCIACGGDLVDVRERSEHGGEA